VDAVVYSGGGDLGNDKTMIKLAKDELNLKLDGIDTTIEEKDKFEQL